MNIIRLDSMVEKVLADLHEEMLNDVPRDTSKPHVTELIYCLTKSYLARKFPMAPTKQETLLFASGLGLEAVMLKQFKRAEVLEVDGILLSLDFFPFDNMIGEFKSTRISSGPTKEGGPLEERILDTGHWRGQIMAYMYAAKVTSTVLIVLHLMGDYRPPFPDLTCWRVDAEQGELDAYWQYLLGRKGVLVNALDEGVAPTPFKYNEDWECKTPCRFRLLCGSGAV